MNTKTYIIALYFENHIFAAEEEFTASEALSVEEVHAIAAEDFEGFTVDNKPVYVGSVKQDYKWSR